MSTLDIHEIDKYVRLIKEAEDWQDYAREANAFIFYIDHTAQRHVKHTDLVRAMKKAALDYLSKYKAELEVELKDKLETYR